MNGSSANPILVIVLTIFVVILFNLGLIVWVRNRKVGNQFKMFQNFMETAKNPWEKTESDLDQLSELLDQHNQEKTKDEIRNQDSTSSE